MATRPLFIPTETGPHLVSIEQIDFTWFPGMAVSQKQKSIRSLHEAAKSSLGIDKVLEISSKSEQGVGIELSAFNLKLELDEGLSSSIESLFQGSKVFKRGGPFTDLYRASAREAKKDPRIKDSGPLTGFEINGQRWALEPRTAFYDWLYLKALTQQPELASAVDDFEAFTDIEFNPKKSINCQAFSAALYCALKMRGVLAEAMKDQASFLAALDENIRLTGTQQSFFD